MPPSELVQVVTMVPSETAEQLKEAAKASERSMAAEMRLAVRAWLNTPAAERAA